MFKETSTMMKLMDGQHQDTGAEPEPTREVAAGEAERGPAVSTAVTADTITDEQIRELVNDCAITFDRAYRAAWRERLPGETVAGFEQSRRAARAACADAWNARNGVKP